MSSNELWSKHGIRRKKLDSEGFNCEAVTVKKKCTKNAH